MEEESELISFGVGLPGPPTYGTLVQIEDGPKLFWDGRQWITVKEPPSWAKTDPADPFTMPIPSDLDLLEMAFGIICNAAPETGQTDRWNRAANKFKALYNRRIKRYVAEQEDMKEMRFPSPAEAEAIDNYLEEASRLERGHPHVVPVESDSVVLRFRGGWPTETSRDIMEVHLRRWFELFMEKQIDYGDAGDGLGLAGQYSEMHRKFGKLKRAMWDGKPLAGEPLEEVLMDLIGHCFLSLRYLEHNNTGSKGNNA